MALAVPQPDVIAETADVLEKPLAIRCGPVTFPDGTRFSTVHLGESDSHSGTAGLLAYRQRSAGAAVEAWEEETGWIPGAAPSDLTPLPFFFDETDPGAPWQSLIVPATGTDAGGDPQFEAVVPGALFPRYFFRAHFALRSNGSLEAGLSPPSRDVRFLSLSDVQRAGVRIGEDQEPESAEEVHVFLRDAGLRTISELSFYNDGGRSRIEIVKLDGQASPVSSVLIDADGTIEVLGPDTGSNRRSRVRLAASGELSLRSAPGQRAIVNDVLSISTSGSDVTLECAGRLTLKADEVAIETDGLESTFDSALRTGRVHYQPATAGGLNDGAPQWLRRTF